MKVTMLLCWLRQICCLNMQLNTPDKECFFSSAQDLSSKSEQWLCTPHLPTCAHVHVRLHRGTEVGFFQRWNGCTLAGQSWLKNQIQWFHCTHRHQRNSLSAGLHHALRLPSNLYRELKIDLPEFQKLGTGGREIHRYLLGLMLFPKCRVTWKV